MSILMAHLKSSSGHLIALCHHTRVGRSRDADLRLPDRRISSEHAVISWARGGWAAKDLGSRNGTVVDGRRLEPGRRFRLQVGSVLWFGSSELKWELKSDDAPDVVALDLDEGRVLEGEQGLLRFDERSYIFTEDGEAYWLEVDGERLPIADRQVVESGGRRWRISLPPPSEGGQTITVDGALLSRNVTLRFRVSPDEENIRVSVIADGVDKELRSRSFDYMLLALARARLRDAASGSLPEHEQGWVFSDELARELGMDVGHVNVDIYRARRRFAASGIQGAEEMLERRPQTRALRLGCGRVEVV